MDYTLITRRVTEQVNAILAVEPYASMDDAGELTVRT